jgi:SAM-dependent MidA family methyltransferase
MCHYRHRAHADPFYLPGLQDITSHIDFSAIARAGLDAGLEVGFYMSQAAFLIGAGLPDLLDRQGAEDPLHWLPVSNAVQKLTSPAEMGELFKAVLLVDRIEVPAYLQRLDQSYRL